MLLTGHKTFQFNYCTIKSGEKSENRISFNLYFNSSMVRLKGNYALPCATACRVSIPLGTIKSRKHGVLPTTGRWFQFL